jgi:hypothetical protein
MRIYKMGVHSVRETKIPFDKQEDNIQKMIGKQQK